MVDDLAMFFLNTCFNDGRSSFGARCVGSLISAFAGSFYSLLLKLIHTFCIFGLSLLLSTLPITQLTSLILASAIGIDTSLLVLDLQAKD
jgi:hypothetical protein